MAHGPGPFQPSPNRSALYALEEAEKSERLCAALVMAKLLMKHRFMEIQDRDSARKSTRAGRAI